jgi:hypothetical protein
VPAADSTNRNARTIVPRRIKDVKSKQQSPRDGQTDASASRENCEDQSSLAEFDPEKYGEITSETEECDTALLAEYALMMSLFALGVAALTGVARSRDLLPRKIKPFDIVLLGIATHKLTRIVAKDRITGALRAPFVHYVKSAGEGEVEEQPRGRGLQRAVGLLVSCPYCLGPWAAAALGFGLVFRPRLTRFFASILTTIALSDFLHRGYALTKEE